MKTLTLTKNQARILRTQLESQDVTDIAEVRKIHRFLDKLEPPCSDFTEQMDAIQKQFDKDRKRILAEHNGQADQYLSALVDELNEKANNLIETVGSEEITFEVEDDHFNTAQDRFREPKIKDFKFRMNRDSRKEIVAIDDAFANAK